MRANLHFARRGAFGRGAWALVCGAALLIGLAARAAEAHPVLLVEADSGRVVEQKDAGAPWYPASVTKLMTIYVALNAMREGRISADTPITVSKYAASQQPSKMGFKPGTKVTLDNAMKMVLVKSANDMAVVVAEGVGGDVPHFVAEMNATAYRLGMTGTHYANPNGLPNGAQVTTARDLAILARAIIYHFPEHEALFRIPAIRLGNRVLRNYNHLIDRYPGADGMKTGFICASGFNLVGSATRGNKRLIAVVLGASSGKARTEETALLLEKGFQTSGSGGLFGGGGQSLESIPNEGGTPTNMTAEACGAKRSVVAAENEDEQPGQGEAPAFPFAFAAPAARANLPASGAELLQNLPPSMDPVPVFVGTRQSPTDLADAYETPAEEKKKSKAAAKAAAAKTASAKPTSDAGKSASDGKTASSQSRSTKPVKPTAAGMASSAPAPAPKPKPKPASTNTAAAKPAS